MIRSFDADTSALTRRSRLNAAGAERDLEAWIIRQVRPQRGMRVLDLGCGTGKQLFALAAIVGREGAIVGADIAEAAVAAVNDRARRDRLPQVSAVRASLDDVTRHFRSDRFDLILSTYAIYYARDMMQLLLDLRALLRPGGRLFVCGPSRGTNRQLQALLRRVAPDPSAVPPPIDDFISAEGIRRLAEGYAACRAVRLANRVRFASAGGLMEWWSHHNSFIPPLRAPVEAAVAEHIARHGAFILAKHVLGVECRA